MPANGVPGDEAVAVTVSVATEKTISWNSGGAVPPARSACQAAAAVLTVSPVTQV